MTAVMKQDATIGFVGNPNSGKTTLFNAFSGANLKVANWPGVTVEKVEGMMKFKNQRYKLVDLPGTYSLTSYTMEEQVARNYILSDDVDVIVDVVDASSLERNLYLTLQLLELGKPVVVALNMDGFDENLDEILAAREDIAELLENEFGCRVKKGLINKDSMEYICDTEA